MSRSHENPFDAHLAGSSDPEGLMATQWEDRLRPPASAEQRLMAAVLIDAIRDYRNGATRHGGRARHLARLAGRWIDSHDRAWPYSFESICAAFDIDAAALRVKLDRDRRAALDAEPVRRRRNLVLTGPRPQARRARRTPAAQRAAVELPVSQVA